MIEDNETYQKNYLMDVDEMEKMLNEYLQFAILQEQNITTESFDMCRTC